MTLEASPAVVLRYAGLGFFLGFLLCAILAGALVWQLRRLAPPPIVLHPPPTAVLTETPMPTATPGPLVVFVSGGMHSPSMYELPAGARVGDALAEAGGLVAEADPALVNQAEALFDGAQVHVPLPQSLGTDAASTTGAPSAGLSGQSSAAAAGTAGNASDGGLVNVQHGIAGGTHDAPRHRSEQGRGDYRRAALRFGRRAGAGARDWPQERRDPRAVC